MLASNAAIYLICGALAIPVLLKTVCVAFGPWHILAVAVSRLLLCLSDYNAIRRLIFFSKKNKQPRWRYSRRNISAIRKQYSTIMIALHKYRSDINREYYTAGMLTKTPLFSRQGFIFYPYRTRKDQRQGQCQTHLFGH